MTKQFFRQDNTEGFSAADLAKLNENVEAILHLWGSNPESATYEDDVKNACDLAHNSFPNAPEIL